MSTAVRELAREDLCRSAPFTITRADDEGSDGLTLEGYGAVFNSVTRIDSWEGSFEETIAPGAFKKSLRERTPKMQFDHGHHPLLGSLPLGRWTTAEEDERGLHLVGRLTDNWLVQPFRDAIRDGGVEGMSFRFSVVRDEWVDKDGKKLRDDELLDLMWNGAGDRGPLRRTLREVKSSEAGPVVWPAYDDTTVGVRDHTGARSVTIDMGCLMRGDAEPQKTLAKLIVLADRAKVNRDNTTAAISAAGITADDATRIIDDLPTPEAGETSKANEPRSTVESASDHPAPGPGTTEDTAGEHPSTRPANPVERAARIKAEYRNRLNRVLALPVNKPQRS